jgi:hypothetical protein
MEAKELERRIGDFEDTVNLCGIDINGPEPLLELLYEDFAVSVGTFFHTINLDILLSAGVITEQIKALCLVIASKVDYLTYHPGLVNTIKGDHRWEEVFALCRQVHDLNQAHKLNS